MKQKCHKLGDEKQLWKDLTLGTENRSSLIAQLVKNLPAMQRSWVQFLGQEDPLEKEMAACSYILT